LLYMQNISISCVVELQTRGRLSAE
jgi:hypothetical protein